MSSSRAGFVVPDRCEAMIDLHLSPDTDTATVRRELQALLIKSRRAIKGLELEFDFAFESGGYQLGPEKRLSAILEEVYPLLNLPLEFVPFRSHSDGNLFYQAGSKPLILGPGSLETAHTADEQTSLAEVEAAARIYAALALG
jgi:acetylornithine deacetylase